MQTPSQITQELKSNLLLNIKPTYTLVLPRNTKVCFHRWLFANPIKPLRYTTGFVEPVNGFNKDVSGARLLPMTVLTYLVVKLIILEIPNVQWTLFITHSRLLFYFMFCTRSICFCTIYRLQMALGV